jgi:ferrochelatase
VLDKLRHYFDHPGFLEPQRDAVRAALAHLGHEAAAAARLVFVAHSVPTVMAAASGPSRDGLYVKELAEAARLIAEDAAPGLDWTLAFSSRSGPPSVPWLEPDVNDELRRLASVGVRDAVVVPVGFVSDHVEVRWDLDHEAAATAAEVGLHMLRTPTPGTDPRFVAMVRELVLERLDSVMGKRACSPMGPSHDRCPDGCCPAPRRPAAAGS